MNFWIWLVEILFGQNIAIVATGNLGMGRCKEGMDYYMFDMMISKEDFLWEVEQLREMYDVIYCYWKEERWVEKRKRKRE